MPNWLRETWWADYKVSWVSSRWMDGWMDGWMGLVDGVEGVSVGFLWVLTVEGGV